MRNIFISFFALVICATTYAQNGLLSGKITDAATKEPIIGASISLGNGLGTVTDIDGNYQLQAAKGDYVLQIAYLGYLSQSKRITLTSNLTLNFNLETITLNEVEVVADVARSRKTPVAFSTITPQKIKEELGSQDLPMILNSTPGVYATQQGGGDGDARVTIRGFDQQNVAVMLDGVPVNDMENSLVYWSNWFGLDAVTRTMQVQRGLGASKIAIPSVGGTINILTQGIESKQTGNVKQELGNDGFMRTSIGYNSGRGNKGWAFTLAGSYKQGDGYVTSNFTEGYFFYGKLEKALGNHTLSASAMGAPQRHGQRSFAAAIGTFNAGYARKLFKGSDEQYDKLIKTKDAYDSLILGSYSQAELNEVLKQTGYTDSASFLGDMRNLNFIDVRKAADRGIRYNQFWGKLNRFTKTPYGDSVPSVDGDEMFSERVNYYHKPMFTLKDSWAINEKLLLVTQAYLSIGKGGGTAFNSTVNLDKTSGQIEVQKVYNANRLSYDFNNGYKANNYLRASVNNHFWYGVMTSLNYKINDAYTFSGGLDYRSYVGQHWREAIDLVGGDYLTDTFDKNANGIIRKQGDKIQFHNDGLVKWGGTFGQLEYSKGQWTAFVNVSGALSANKRIDYFKPKDLVINGEVFNEIVGRTDVFYYNGTNGIVANNNATITRSGDTTYINNSDPSKQDGFIVNATAYSNLSNEARYAETKWKYIPGGTFKTGVNYNINDNNNVFFNIGYLSRAARFANVFDNQNNLLKDIRNEIVKAVEGGYSYTSPKFTANINAYYTIWDNRPLIGGATGSDQVTLEPVRVNVNGLNALHQGIELDFAYLPIKNLELEGLMSLGDWVYTSSGTIMSDDPNVELDDTTFNAKGIKVGNAAQTQFGASAKYTYKNIYLKPRITYFGDQYSNFSPFAVREVDEGRQTWKVPNYAIVDLHLGYKLKWNKSRINLTGSIFNIFNTLYITDANNNDSRGLGVSTLQNFDAQSASVFFGQGRRFNASISFTF